MNIVHVLEAGMLVCFGISWPFNIAKSIRSRTADLVLTLRNRRLDRERDKV